MNEWILLVFKIYLAIKGKAVPLEVWSGPEGSRKLRFPDFMTTAHDGGKVVSLAHRPLLTPGNAPGTHFCYRLSRPQGHSAIWRILYQWKLPMTPDGIEPATVRFVAQHLNHCATAVPVFRHNYEIPPLFICLRFTISWTLTHAVTSCCSVDRKKSLLWNLSTNFMKAISRLNECEHRSCFAQRT